MTPRSVLIWGGDSWANRGDAAVLAGTLAMLRQQWPDACVTVASDRPEQTRPPEAGVPAVRRRSMGFLRSLWQADLVLWGGGQMIQNASSKLFLFFQIAFLVMALILRKNVICFAQGVGPVSGAASRFLIRAVLERLRLIMVRDSASAQRLLALGLAPERVQVTADPSFCLEPAPQRDVAALLQRMGVQRPFLAVALRRWGHYKGDWLPVRLTRRTLSAAHQQWFAVFCRDMAAALDAFRKETGLDILFVPMCPGGDQEDDQVARSVLAEMAGQEGLYLLDEDVSPGLLKGLLGNASLVLAMRTHAGMLAADAGAPVAFLSYQGKGEGFLDEVGLSEYGLDVDSFSLERVRALLFRAWRDRAWLQAKLAERLPALRVRARQNMELVADVVGGKPQVKAVMYPPRTIDADRWARLTSGKTRPGDALLPSRLSGILAERRRIVLELARLLPGDLVLDLGCGVGHYAEPVSRTGAAWLGVDASAEMLAYAQAAGPATKGLVRGNALQLPLQDGVVDLCLCIGVLDYVPSHDLEVALEEMARVVRPGGRMVISCNSSWWGGWLRGLLPMFQQGFPPRNDHARTLSALMTSTGLELRQTCKLRAGFLGPDTLIYVAIKKQAICDSAVTTAPSSRLVSA